MEIFTKEFVKFSTNIKALQIIEDIVKHLGEKRYTNSVTATGERLPDLILTDYNNCANRKFKIV